MDLAVIHTIHDGGAWKQALADDNDYPPGFNLRSFVQAADGTRALCLWEATGQTELQERLDQIFGRCAVNDVFAVEIDYFEERSNRPDC